ncbi:amino acid carrier protein [Terasakiella sp. SH-1]|uniref:alanine/glycine:cation symporter family protein n=1 Tax=Terasakiella sp. SH-1 TaxID=2560057 RepID=UPI0014306F04|nr:amino acid carrier protein [Terasakiella sp. SH-1]
METIASILWNPFLVFIYLELGLLFVVLTRGAAIRGVWNTIAKLWHVRREGKHHEGEHVAHYAAFIAALSASVGVGNLAGVGTALHLGGPGALFWMWVSALLGMSFRMSSVFFAVKLAKKYEEHDLFATPMFYIVELLGKNWRWLATALAAMIMIKGMVTANLIQANSVAHAISGEIGVSNIWVALLLGSAVALVVVGGFKSILKFSTITAPWMIVGYLLCGWFILLFTEANTLEALGSVFKYAFQPYSIAGGVAGYAVLETLQYGISRGIFSHGSGIGIAPFWQGANRDCPAQSSMLAAAVPVVDTLIVCTTTGLVVLTANQWMDTTGAFLTVSSFTQFTGEIGRILVTACLVVFAFTTIINWAHFSERCFEYLGGTNVKYFRYFFAGVTFVGPFLPLGPLWSLGDILIGTMLIIHLMPLTYIVVRHSKVMCRELLSANKNNSQL